MADLWDARHHFARCSSFFGRQPNVDSRQRLDFELNLPGVGVMRLGKVFPCIAAEVSALVVCRFASQKGQHATADLWDARHQFARCSSFLGRQPKVDSRHLLIRI